MEYHKTKNILHVMQVLGHKNIKNTLVYVRLAEELFHTTSDYITETTKSVKQTRKILEAGFEYVLEMDSLRIFRKSKQEETWKMLKTMLKKLAEKFTHPGTLFP